jgi:hypothetical protein
MSADQDIRAWARAEGIDVNVKGPVSQKVRERWAARNTGPAAAPETGPAPADGAETRGGSAELSPGPKQSWWKRQREPRPPRPPGLARRVSLENLVTTAWGIGGKMMEARMLPVARILEMQAPVAGMVVDDLAKDTAVDVLLQPLARAGEKGERLFALAGPPLLVGAICQNPALYPVVRPMLKTSMLLWIEVSEPAMRKAQKRAKSLEEKLGGADIDAMIDALFAPPPGYEPGANGQEPAAAAAAV